MSDRLRSWTRRLRPREAAPEIRRPSDRLPPAVSMDLREPVRDLWMRRVAQSVWDTYAGVPMMKFPEDLRVYEHILWSQRVEVVVELGLQFGGSALWFRDRLRTLRTYGRIARPRVIAVDLDVSEGRSLLEQADPSYADEITLVAGDLRDRSVAAHVRGLVAPESSCLVVEDSAHTYDTTAAALRGFSSLVRPGGWFVVEDGCVDIEEMRLHPDWPRGALAAVSEWLATDEGRSFERVREMELYGISCHPQGFLRRRPDGDSP